MNKNVSYNGISYANGSEIKESDPGFKDLKQAGHVDTRIEQKAAPAPKAAPVVEENTQPIDLPAEHSEPEQEPEPKVKRRGRK